MKILPVIAAGLALAASVPAFAQATSPATPVMTGSTGNMMHGPKDPSAIATAVQAILQKFQVNRDQVMAQRQAMIDKLAAAKTDADRQAILKDMKTEMLAAKDQRTQMAKEIRDELQKLRQQRKGGGG